MEMRTLGRTGLKVSAIGIGTWAMGSQWGAQDDQDSIAALHEALDAGCRFIDTAQSYGEGRSEGLVAKVMRDRPELEEQVVICTKIPPENRRQSPGPEIPIADAFRPAYLRERVEVSLRQLDTERLDVVLLHAWAEHWNSDDAWYETMLALKQEGKIKSFGISVSPARPDEANDSVAKGRPEVVQVIYNMLDQRAAKHLFPLALEHNMGIIARVPLASGALSGRFHADITFPEGDWRGGVFVGERLQQTLEQVEAVKSIVGADQLVQKAISFSAAHPAVHTVIPGARSAKQARENTTALETAPLSPEQLEQLRALAR